MYNVHPNVHPRIKVFILKTICDNLEMVKPMWSAAAARAHSLDLKNRLLTCSWHQKTKPRIHEFKVLHKGQRAF